MARQTKTMDDKSETKKMEGKTETMAVDDKTETMTRVASRPAKRLVLLLGLLSSAWQALT